MTPELKTPEPGQVWKLVDKKIERFVRVIGTIEQGQSVKLQNVRKQHNGWVPINCGHSYINIDRFQGQPGGWKFHSKGVS
jgi:hypothetical protein